VGGAVARVERAERYSGYFSFGHAVFWGLGAYTVALGMIYLNLTPWLTIPLSAIVGSAAGALIGYPTFRLRGHYFALAMLAYRWRSSTSSSGSGFRS